MNDVVTRITNTVKDINSGKTPVKMPTKMPTKMPVKMAAKMPALGTKSTPSGSWDIMTILKIFLIIVILALLGFNVFAYLAKGTDVFKTFMVSYGKYIPDGIKKTLNLTEKGTELGLDVAAGTIQDVKKIITKETGKKPKIWDERDNKPEQSINAGNFKGLNNFPHHEPDKSDSAIQEQGKKGWCYIGTDRTFRSCINVNKSDVCMSGKIFPTKDICINPSLRQ